MREIQKTLMNASVVAALSAAPLLVGCVPQWHLDADADGYGDPNEFVTADQQPDGYVANGNDCDDGNPDINPGQVESFDSIDNDCDSAIDEGHVPTVEPIKVAAQFVSTTEDATVDVSVANSGAQDLIWSLAESESGNCDNPADIPWFSANITEGVTAANSETAVQFLYSGAVSGGRYNAAVCLESNDPNMPVMRIPLVATVDAPSADMLFDTLRGIFSGGLGGTYQVLTRNDGRVPVEFVVREAPDGDCNVAGETTWLSVTYNTNVLQRLESTNLQVTYDSTGVEPGEYATTVCLMDASEQIVLDEMEVTMRVSS